MTYNAAQIIGKTLYAQRAIALKRLPSDSAPSIYNVPSGSMVGVVDSYINPQPGRNANLYWQFKDANGRYYYAEHKPGNFSEKEIKNQGATSTEQMLQDQANKDKPTSEKIMELVKWGVIIGGLFYLGGTFIKSQSGKSFNTKFA